jgi:hypothetical protein
MSDIESAIYILEKAIKREKKYGYGGICWEMDTMNYTPNIRNLIIRYVKQRYYKVVVFMEQEQGREIGYNYNGAYVGDLLSFDFESSPEKN